MAALTIAPERDIAADLVRRAALLAPAVLAVAAAGWGVNGALSAAYSLGLVAANFLASAAVLGWAVRRSPAATMAAALGGFVLRMGVILLAVLVVEDHGWVELVPLGATLFLTHLGLLFWETKRISASLAFPGLKPAAGFRANRRVMADQIARKRGSDGG